MVVLRVIVVGAGAVGREVAKTLASAHDVIVIDSDPQVVENLPYDIDVLTVEGDGTDEEVLTEADISQAEMLIAATDDDKANVIICDIATSLTELFTIARVKQEKFLRSWQRSKDVFGADFVISTDVLVAKAVLNVMELPNATTVDTFADGLAQMATFQITPENAVAGQTIEAADQYDILTFVAISRDGELIIPKGETTIKAGDELIVAGSVTAVQEFATDSISNPNGTTDDLVIIGGTQVGQQIARRVAAETTNTRLIEPNHERAVQLADILSKTRVLEGNTTDREFLTREGIHTADTVVVCLAEDEQNLMTALLLKRLGASRVVSIVESAENAELFETFGVDVAINPQHESAEEIIRFARSQQAKNLAIFGDKQAEAVELVVEEDDPFAGESIATLAEDLLTDLVVGVVVRGGELISPRGDTVIAPGDRIIVFGEDEAIQSMLTNT